MAKKRLQEEDVAELYDIATRQLREDREDICGIFTELREYVRGNETRYIDMGEVLAKIAELKMKQTGQVVDVFKVLEKAVPEDESGVLNEADLDFISKELKKEKEGEKDDGAGER